MTIEGMGPISRRRALGIGATAAGAAAIGIVGVPGSASASSPASHAAGPALAGAVNAIPGATVVARSMAAWQVIGGAVGYVAPDCVYANGGFAQMDLGLPTGAQLIQVDVFGRASVGQIQSYSVDWRSGDGSTSGTFMAGSGSGLAQQQVSMIAPLHPPALGTGDQVVVNCGGATGASANSAVGTVVVQYIDPRSAYQLIDPVRVYDSRWPVESGVMVGVFHAPTVRSLDCRAGRDLATGAVTVASAIPDFAKAISFNLTVVAASPLGYLAVTPTSSISYTASSINWSTMGETIANGGAVELDPAGDMKVWAGGGSAHVIVDVTGYYF